MRRETAGALAWLALLVVAGGGEARAQGTAAASRRASAAHLVNAREVRERLGVSPAYDNLPGVESVKVAVLDYGFDGVGTGRPYLPASAELVEHYDPDFVRRHRLGDPEYRKPFEPGNRHGRVMAQVVWAVTGSRPLGPKFYLLNANGPTMLRRAVRFAVEHRVDVVLFSGSFEGGGNGDGGGPIDRAVDEAVAAGVLWVNAAGNYGGRAYNGPVRLLPDGFLRLRDGSDVASLRFRNRFDENAVTVTLTWNDYQSEEDAGTTRDLDLYVEDWAGRRVGTGAKVQIAGDRPAGPDETRNPRERVVLMDLPANPEVRNDPDYCYRIRVRAKSGRFSRSDRIRILLTAGRDLYAESERGAPVDAVEFVDASGSGEIYPPADHPGVLTVGDTSPASSSGPTLDGRVKPEVVLDDSRAFFTDGQVTAGSSNAAAYVAGVVALLKAAEPGLRIDQLLRLARQGPPARPAAVRGVLAARGTATPPPPPVPSGPRLWRTPTRSELARAVRPRSGR